MPQVRGVHGAVTEVIYAATTLGRGRNVLGAHSHRWGNGRSNGPHSRPGQDHAEWSERERRAPASSGGPSQPGRWGRPPSFIDSRVTSRTRSVRCWTTRSLGSPALRRRLSGDVAGLNGAHARADDAVTGINRADSASVNPKSRWLRQKCGVIQTAHATSCLRTTTTRKKFRILRNVMKVGHAFRIQTVNAVYSGGEALCRGLLTHRRAFVA